VLLRLAFGEKFIFKMAGFLLNKSRRGGIASSTIKH
jgi:hypothetical protein